MSFPPHISPHPTSSAAVFGRTPVWRWALALPTISQTMTQVAYEVGLDVEVTEYNADLRCPATHDRVLSGQPGV